MVVTGTSFPLKPFLFSLQDTLSRKCPNMTSLHTETSDSLTCGHCY